VFWNLESPVRQPNLELEAWNVVPRVAATPLREVPLKNDPEGNAPPPAPRAKRIRIPAAVLLLALAAALALSYRPSLPGNRVTVVFTQEVGGNALSCGCWEGQPGGLAGLSAAFGDLLRHRSTLLLDAGDFVRNPSIRGFQDPEVPRRIPAEKRAYLEKKHAAVAGVMMKLGYDAVAPGDRDFLLGQSFLLSLEHDLGVPFVNANLRFAAAEKPTSVFPEHRLFRLGRGSVLGIPFGGVTVGVFGLVSRQLPRPSSPGDAYVFVAADPEAAAREQTARMAEAGAEIVVLLFHGSWSEAEQLALRVPGIDLIIVGQTGQSGRPLPMRALEGTRLVQAGAGAVQAGRADLILRDRRVAEVEFETVTLYSNDLGLLDADVVRPFLDFEKRLEAAPVAPPFLSAVDQPYAGPKACADCHETEWEQWRQTRHARALESLRARGHAGDPECLQCHTTGYGRQGGFGSPGAPEEALGAVGCEVCHGPRAEHAATWKARKEEGRDLPEAEAIPSPYAMHCILCHDTARDPGFKPNALKRQEAVRHRKRD
jgi:hypothetical protein